MKVRITLDLSDSVREYIAQMSENCKTSSERLAKRESCVAFLESLVERMHLDQIDFTKRLTAAREEVYFGSLTDSDIGDANDAVAYLRAQGKTDAGIRAWLIKQRARAAVQHERIDLAR